MDKETLIRKLDTGPVIPVLDPKDVSACLSAVDALIAGGAVGIEITLRSPEAPKALGQIRKTYPDIVLGAGSVMDIARYDQAVDLGADFTIAPGRCPDVEARAAGGAALHIPGIMTPSEIIAARADGLNLLKYYPSEPAGGARTLKDLGRIFPDVRFMPSGGIKLDLLPGYAAVPTVLSVGGSWMYAKDGAYLPSGDISEQMQRSLQFMLSARS